MSTSEISYNPDDEIGTYITALDSVEQSFPFINTVHPAGIYLVRLMQDAQKAKHAREQVVIHPVTDDPKVNAEVINDFVTAEGLITSKYSHASNVLNRYYAVAPGTTDPDWADELARSISTIAKTDIETFQYPAERNKVLFEVVEMMCKKIVEPSEIQLFEQVIRQDQEAA
jgi:hypothetical protein